MMLLYTYIIIIKEIRKMKVKLGFILKLKHKKNIKL